MFGTKLSAILVTPGEAAFLIGQVAMYQARVGRRRTYLSRADALAYERGWATFPAPYVGPLNTPESAGWFDHECAYLDAQDAMRSISECDGLR